MECLLPCSVYWQLTGMTFKGSEDLGATLRRETCVQQRERLFATTSRFYEQKLEAQLLLR